jgi:hypothetical protein
MFTDQVISNLHEYKVKKECILITFQDDIKYSYMPLEDCLPLHITSDLIEDAHPTNNTLKYTGSNYKMQSSSRVSTYICIYLTGGKI